QLPWLLVMVVQFPELFWVHPKFTCHLHVLMRQVEPAPRVDPRLQACTYPFLILLHHSGVPRSGSVFASKWRLHQWPRPQSVRGVFVRRSSLKSIGKFWSGKVDGSGACV